MDRSNHYEAAFEAFLRWHRLSYIAVDETRRSFLGETNVKSLDFIVFGASGTGLLVDIKGRRYPGGNPEKPRRVWESWSTEEDISGLARWRDRFGPSFMGLLVFAYDIQPGAQLPNDDVELWTWRNKRYWYRALAIEDYQPHMRARSPRWGTVSLPTAVFRELARPLDYFTRGLAAISEDCPI
jgi:hypothetical protein